MSLLVLGLSHHLAPVDLLEQVALDPSGERRLLDLVAASENVAEAVVVSTCNRMEIYVEAVTFHGAVIDVTDALLAVTDTDRDLVGDRLYLHFEDRAIAHVFRVASGLDSMALGESQIRSQLRSALQAAQQARTAGPAMNALLQQALRVGKRVHTETEIDSVSRSLVQESLLEAEERLGPVAGLDVALVGAGGMAALAAITLTRCGARSVTVVSRTLARAEALAARIDGRAAPLDELDAIIARADLVFSCTGSAGLVVDADRAARAQAARGARPQVYVDLALPHDIAYDVEKLPGVDRIGLDRLGGAFDDLIDQPAVKAAGDLVTGEVAAFLTARAGEVAAPTIAALRARASGLLATEIDRLATRAPDLTDAERREVEVAMSRLVDKLLHTPTLRVKAMAADGRFDAYAAALAELFELDPRDLATATQVPAGRRETLGDRRSGAHGEDGIR